MELKEGMYVRTRYGIAKITNLTISARAFYLDKEIMECNEENWTSYCTIHDIIGEPSFQIIDLIEEGDYVNGSKVVSVYTPSWSTEKWIDVEEIEDDDGKYGNGYVGYCNNQIKSVVTKEQFKRDIYEVGE